jgi:hypothetical protein
VRQSGNFTFTSSEAGDYLACFWAPYHRPPTTIAFEFDWRSGVSAKDWSSVAKKGQVDVNCVAKKGLSEAVNLRQKVF